MADSEKKRTWSDRWDDLKAEFQKIVWADKTTIGRQTTAVTIVSIILALLIVFFDMLIQYGVDKLAGI